MIYRVKHPQSNLDWVDFDLGCSTILASCSASSASFPTAQAAGGTCKIKVNPTQVLRRCVTLYGGFETADWLTDWPELPAVDLLGEMVDGGAVAGHAVHAHHLQPALLHNAAARAYQQRHAQVLVQRALVDLKGPDSIEKVLARVKTWYFLQGGPTGFYTGKRSINYAVWQMAY